MYADAAGFANCSILAKNSSTGNVGAKVFIFNFLS